MTYFTQRASDAAYTQSLYKNVNAMFWDAFNADDPEGALANAWMDIADEYRSGTSSEVYPFMEPPDGMKEWLGARPTTSIVDRVFSVDNKKFAQGVKIKLDDARDQRLGIYRDPIANLAAQARLLWNELLAAALEAGKSTTWAPDGQLFFDSDHPISIDGQVAGTYQNNYDNTATGGSAAFALTYANLLQLLRYGRQLKLPNGKPMPIRYDSIIVGGDLVEKALDLTQKQMIAPAAGSGVEAASVLQENSLVRSRLNVIYLPQLSESGTWYLAALGRKGARPCGVQIRENIRFQRVGPVGTPDVEAEGGDGEIVSANEYHFDYVEMGPRARGNAFLKWPWRIIRANG